MIPPPGGALSWDAGKGPLTPLGEKAASGGDSPTRNVVGAVGWPGPDLSSRSETGPKILRFGVVAPARGSSEGFGAGWERLERPKTRTPRIPVAGSCIKLAVSATR